MIEFRQLNLHKSAHATSLAGQAMEKKNRIVSLFTEPYTTCGRITGMPRGTTVVYDRSDRGGQPPVRAAIIASADLGLTAMDSWCSRDCAVALVKIQGQQTIIVSLYMDIKRPVITKEIREVMQMINKKDLPVIIGCLLYTSPSPRDRQKSRMPSSA